MSALAEKFLQKLSGIAKTLDREKPKLRFFGLVHRPEAPWGRWDLVVASDTLTPWVFESLQYINRHLQARLTAREMVHFATIVVLPPKHPLIAEFRDDPDAIVLWPREAARRQPASA